MAIGTAPQMPRDASADQRDAVIQRQLNRARRQVRMVELSTSLIGLVVAVLFYFLLLALVDHWLLPLGLVGRWLALVVLVGGVAAYVLRFVAPLLVHSIHPLYAAQTIERSSPALKNSVLNFLFFRNQPGAVPTAVYDNLRHAAAENLSKVTVDAAVDRGHLIRALYLFTAILAACAVYKLASPKDPFQTATRVFRPWAAIAAPSRVEITEVSPGNATATFGDLVEVRATVKGVGASDQVRIVYSTDDRQIVNRILPMQSNRNRTQFSAKLPPDDEGLQQSVTYQVLAGDAVGQLYELKLLAQPMIFVQKLEYEYPRYMDRPPQAVEGQGDIEAWENTLVTVRARANKSIREAYVEWNPLETEPNTDRSAAPARLQRLTLESEGIEAWGSFPLQLQADRKRPVYASYQLRFVTDEGQVNEAPVPHRITVLPDLAPEIDILSPKKRSSEVPENAQRSIEVRAIDPDFGLKRVTLRGSAVDREPWEHQLLDSPTGHRGQFVQKYDFIPQELGLKAGDVVTYRAAAEDNRQDYQGNSEPNQALTIEYQFTITPAEESFADRGKPNADPMNEPSPERADADGSGEERSEQDGEMPPAERSPRNAEKRADEQAALEQENEQSADEPSADGGEEQADQPSDASQSGASDPNNAGESAPGQSTPTSGDNASGGAGSQEGAENSNGQQGGEPQAGQASQGGQSGDSPNESQGPVDPNSRHDGDVIDGVLRHLEETGQVPPSNASNSSQAGEAQQSNSEDHPSDGNQTGDPQGGRGPRPTGAERYEGSHQDPDGSSADNSSESGIQGESPSTEPMGQGEREQRTGAQNESTSPPSTRRQRDSAAKPDAESPGDAATAAESSEARGAAPMAQTGRTDRADRPDAADASEPSAADRTAEKPEPKSPENVTEEHTGEPEQRERQPPGATSASRPKPEGPEAARPAGGQGSPKREQPSNEATEPGNEEANKSSGDGTGGEAGAGQDDQQEAGVGSPKNTNRDRQKQQKPDDQSRPSDSNEPPGTSESKHQSDSKGDSSGNLSGGGKQGAGQNAQQPGGDAPGSQQESDQGAGVGQQSGTGEMADRAGGNQGAAGSTGAAGGAPGAGSSGSEGEAGNEAGGDASGAAANSPDATSQNARRGAREGSGATRPGGGLPPQGQRPRRPQEPSAPEELQEAEPNLEYSRKATDLVLEYLKDQAQKPDPDPKLLDKLGWTKDELDEFVSRWDAMKKAAETDPSARQQLDESLRSLGLRPVQDRYREGGARQDTDQGNSDAARDSSPPLKYLQQFNDFRRGVSRATDEIEE